MTAAVNPVGVNADEVIAGAKAILAANRGLTAVEQQQMRDALFHLGQRDRLSHDMLAALLAEIDRRAASRSMQMVIDSSVSVITAQVRHDQARPKRWALELSQIQRAGFLVADELGGTGIALARAFLRFANLVEAETATRKPPATFEQEER